MATLKVGATLDEEDPEPRRLPHKYSSQHAQRGPTLVIGTQTLTPLLPPAAPGLEEHPSTAEWAHSTAKLRQKPYFATNNFGSEFNYTLIYP